MLRCLPVYFERELDFSNSNLLSGVRTRNGNLSTVTSEISSWMRVQTLLSEAIYETKNGSSSTSGPVKRAVIEFQSVFFGRTIRSNAFSVRKIPFPGLTPMRDGDNR
jgi:hypothetical protein